MPSFDNFTLVKSSGFSVGQHRLIFNIFRCTTNQLWRCVVSLARIVFV